MNGRRILIGLAVVGLLVAAFPTYLHQCGNHNVVRISTEGSTVHANPNGTFTVETGVQVSYSRPDGRATARNISLQLVSADGETFATIPIGDLSVDERGEYWNATRITTTVSKKPSRILPVYHSHTFSAVDQVTLEGIKLEETGQKPFTAATESETPAYCL